LVLVIGSIPHKLLGRVATTPSKLNSSPRA
jgi:hypothetical protein